MLRAKFIDFEILFDYIVIYRLFQ